MNRQFEWSTNRFTRFTWSMYWKFINISVWLFGLNNSNIGPNINKLGLRIEQLVKLSGSTFAVQYLKESLRLSQKFIADEQTESSSEPRVATRRGLPLIIPGDLRLLIEAKDPKVIKLVLTVLSVFRVIPAFPKLKLETITSPFKGVFKTTPEIIPIVQQLKSLYIKSNNKYFNADISPYVVGSRILTLTTAGPNHKNQLFGYPLDALAFSQDPDLLKVFTIFAMKTGHQSLVDKLHSEIEHWISDSYKEQIQSWIPNGISQLKLGKLALKHEAAGKVRVFAIVDAWTQSLLHPLHKSLFDILSNIPSDGTFNQLKPVKVLMEKGFNRFWSFDLSAATDRLPIDLQVEILSELFNSLETAEAWRDLLVSRDYHLDSDSFPDQKGSYRYAVGQPMGALSSWAMLALTHHVIVQVAARRIGFRNWFHDYALLGDDIVIANAQVANSYLTLMEDLGVDINLSKSLVSSNGTAEFAKKLIKSNVDLSPLGPKSIFEFIKSPLHFKDIFINYGLYHNINDPLIDGEVLVGQLTNLFKNFDSLSSPKWKRRVKSSYWDIVSCFGLNLVQDLSPSLLASAVDSLDTKDLNTFNKAFDDLLKSKVTHGWFHALESDEQMYRKYRRFYSFSTYVSQFPSTQDMLSNLSEMLQQSASHYLYDFDKLSRVDQIRLAYSSLSRISWAIGDKPKSKRNVKSMELSRDLLFSLGSTSPDLLIKVVQASQAVSTFDKVEDSTGM